MNILRGLFIFEDNFRFFEKTIYICLIFFLKKFKKRCIFKFFNFVKLKKSRQKGVGGGGGGWQKGGGSFWWKFSVLQYRGSFWWKISVLQYIHHLNYNMKKYQRALLSLLQDTSHTNQ